MNAQQCERDGCESPGSPYFIHRGVVHSGDVQIGTGFKGEGWITLCADHALTDLGVAIA